MKPSIKQFLLAILVMTMTSALLVGCGGRGASQQGLGSGPGPGPGPGVGPYTIGGGGTGLAPGRTRLVLQDNATENLTITGNGPFTFKIPIATGKPYNVSISTPATSPPQTCTVAN